MTMFQERQRPHRPDLPGGDENALGGGLEQTRVSGHALARAGQEAIRQVLSQDSRSFLGANRQHPGQ
jgi:hypothetical protein